LVKDALESVALFGGSFDPPHIGHKSVVEEALRILKIEKVIVIPTFLNPFKSNTYFSTYQRFTMTQEMFQNLSNVQVDDFEIKEAKSTPTAITLKHFQHEYDVNYFIIGSDNLASIDKWYNFKWINEQITWVIATRRGYRLDTSKLRAFKILEIDEDISSTEIRKSIVKEKSYMNMDERVERIVTFLDSKKAEEIESFNLEKIDYLAKRVIIANSLGSKHASALADQLKKELKPLGEEFLHVDESEEWVVIDLGDILIHVMTSEARQMYSLEEFLTELSNGKYTVTQLT
jgi:nicotinate-nucleotide adenylyltransferase